LLLTYLNVLVGDHGCSLLAPKCWSLAAQNWRGLPARQKVLLGLSRSFGGSCHARSSDRVPGRTAI